MQSEIGLIETGGASIEIRRDVFDDYNARLDAEHEKGGLTQGNADNGTTNAESSPSCPRYWWAIGK